MTPLDRQAIDQQGRELFRRLSTDQKRKVVSMLEELLKVQNRKAGGAA